MQQGSYAQRNDRHRWLTGILLLLVLLPVAITYLVLWHTASPIPYMDDYDAVLAFANHYQQLPTLPARLLYINDSTHVQYKLVLLHGIVAGELGMLHHVSLSFIRWIGDLSLLLIAGCLWQMVPKMRLWRRLLLFLPVSCFVFMLRDSEALGWAMACLQQVSALGFCLFALLAFLSGPRRWFLCGCFAFVLAAWTSANGFLVVPVALVAMAQRRQWRRGTALLAVTAAVLGCYLHGFHPGLDPNTAHAGPSVIPGFFLTLLGNVFSRWWLALPYGVVLLLAVLPVVWRALRSGGQLNSVSAAILFLLLNAGLITAGRYHFSLVGALASRYSLYSQVLSALAYLAYVRPTTAEKTGKDYAPVPVYVWLSCMFAIALFAHYENVGARLSREQQLASQAHVAAWEHYGPSCSLVAVDTAEVQRSMAHWAPHASEVLQTSIRQGTYTPPQLPASAGSLQTCRSY